MRKFTFAFTKEKKQVFIPNGDKTRYVIISGCPTESVNGTFYPMDPINDNTYDLYFTNGVYMLQVSDVYHSLGNLYESSNSTLTNKYHFYQSNNWINDETMLSVPEMNAEYIRKLGIWPL